MQCNTGDNKVARKRGKGLASETVTLPERLHTLGYYSGLIGKWHLGLKPGMTPTDQGFDEFFGFLGATHLYLPSEEDAKMLRGETPEPEHEKEYLTGRARARVGGRSSRATRTRPFVAHRGLQRAPQPVPGHENYLSASHTGMKRSGARTARRDRRHGRRDQADPARRWRRRAWPRETVVFFASDNGAPLDEGAGLERRLRGGRDATCSRAATACR